MTLVLGIIAAVLLIAVVIAIIKSSAGKGDTLAFTSPGDLAAGMRSASTPTNPLIDEPSSPVTTRPQPAAPAFRPGVPTDLSPGNLGLDTAITFGGQTGMIVGVLSFNYQGDIWHDYVVTAPGGGTWRLTVDPIEETEGELREISTRGFVRIDLEPGASHLQYEGRSFTLTRSGPADYRSLGNTGHFLEGRYWYYDYRDDAGETLSFERYDSGPWLAALGRSVHEAQIHVDNYPE